MTTMKQNSLKVHPDDNVIVALTNLQKGEVIIYGGQEIILQDDVQAKHKFTTESISEGGKIIMYGVLVGRVQIKLEKGSLISTANVKHAADPFKIRARNTSWEVPDIKNFIGKTFNGFHRTDGSVGTANYWLVIPMVFCENRNLDVLQESLLAPLGYGQKKKYQEHVIKLIDMIRDGYDETTLINTPLTLETTEEKKERVFPNVDGIKFLVHNGGCGGTREDAQTLCGLLAGYITNSNVAGATVLSLGCQNAQVSMLEDEIKKRNPLFDKPLYILEQQQVGTEADLFSLSIKQTLAGLIQANRIERKAAPLSKLCIGLECGGSDGFSGISANPAIGYTSDLLVALGGSVILSEFPELCGVEQDLSDRCVSNEQAERFSSLMKTYNSRAIESGSGFDMNPSPGNIKDGLITDAIKSAGAAKKGGTSPVVEVLDYPEKVSRAGLNLLCTPGNDVESTTAEVASGANIVLFTTGLGTPTGNPIAPVIKIASNTTTFNRMRDIMDLNTGSIIEGNETIFQAGERILDYIISVASGETEVAAVRHKQDDFIPWKRGISL